MAGREETSTENQRVPWTRTARSEDLDSIVRLVALMHDEEPPLAEVAGTYPSVLHEILSQPNRFLLVGGIDEQVTGTADMVVVQNLSRGGRPWAVVENVVVDPAYRRRGIARMLMLVLIRIAVERDCYKMQLVSAERRDEAHALYKALRFDAPVRGFRLYLNTDGPCP